MKRVLVLIVLTVTIFTGCEDPFLNEFEKEVSIATDKTAPEAPVVRGPAATGALLPRWIWEEVEGASVYRSSFTNGVWLDESFEENYFVPNSPLSDGSYTLFVQAGDAAGNWSNSGSFTITVDSNASDAPVVNGVAITVDRTPTWSWVNPDGITGIRYQVNNQSPDGWTETSDIETISYTPDIELDDGIYTLYVQAKDAAGNWSLSGSFTTAVDLNDSSIWLNPVPKDYGLVSRDFTNLRWTAVEGAVQYRIKITNERSTVDAQTAVISDTNMYNSGIVYNDGDRYYWRVAAVNELGQESVWSPIYEFGISSLGEFEEGGYIFYFDGLGGGLVAAEEDFAYGSDYKWGWPGDYIGNTDVAVGTGKQNTEAIVDYYGETLYWKYIASESVKHEYLFYHDWFLPSKEELDLMWTSLFLEGIGDFVLGESYISSSEIDEYYYWSLIFVAEMSYYDISEKDNMYNIRFVRAF